MTNNTAVKQARVWRAEIREMARRGRPHPEAVIAEMADILSKHKGVEEALGVSMEGKREDEIPDELSKWLKAAEGS